MCISTNALKHCFKNSSCALKKILSKFSQDTAMLISEISPKIPSINQSQKIQPGPMMGTLHLLRHRHNRRHRRAVSSGRKTLAGRFSEQPCLCKDSNLSLQNIK
uniref:Uncharacterized protein n=1 Tax=Cacopsylla melanoneura TaxID=428564 RepID=A0A8D8Z5I7_9HEMI